MLFLRDSWIFWLVVSISCLVILKIRSRNRIKDVDKKLATSSDQFSMKTVFFSFKRGEADVFLLILLSMIAFLFFSLGFISDIFIIVQL